MGLKTIIKKIPFLKKFFKNAYIQKKSVDFAKLSQKASTDPKLLVFESYQGRSFSCSPKAIYEYMLKQPEFADFRYVWVFRDTDTHGEFPENTRLVKFDSEESFEAYANAGTWIVNSRLRDFIVPREDQRYIQCWHGTPFKKIGCDVKNGGNATSTVEEIYNEYKNDSLKITKFISPSDFTTEKLMSAFALENADKIIQKGYPRNDALVMRTDEKIQNIKRALGIPDDKICILYCPTFRDSSYDAKGYTLDMELDIERLKKLYGEDIFLLVRFHYFIADSFDDSQYEGFVKNVSSYDDVNDLYMISDVLITDYSSVFFDYAVLSRPIIFYIYDIEEYKNNMRDFYFGTAMLPGFTVNDQEKLEKVMGDIIADIKKGGNGLLRYKTAMPMFNKRFNPLEDGQSAKRVVKEIFEK